MLDLLRQIPLALKITQTVIMHCGTLARAIPAYDVEAVSNLDRHPIRSKRRGNPTWGKPVQVPNLPTEFDLQVKQLGLTKADYVRSAQLKRWCEHNRNRVYVPEWLLREWGIVVESVFSGPG